MNTRIPLLSLALLALLCPSPARSARPWVALADSFAAAAVEPGVQGASAAGDSAARPAAPASPVAEEGAWAAAEEESYLWMVGRLLLGLAVVVALAVAAVHLLRRSGLGRQFAGSSGVIRVVERVYLSPKKQICLVEIGGRVLALGVTEAGMTTLASWGAGELALPPPAPPSGSFAAQLRGLLGQDRAGAGSQEGVHP
ncbi:MAG: flagellar biosynthetic protein FliO [Candidatus Latescibacterota bacterium]